MSGRAAVSRLSFHSNVYRYEQGRLLLELKRMFSHVVLKAEPDVTMIALWAAEVTPGCDCSTGKSTTEKLPSENVF